MVFLTGATGFIGRAVLERLLEEGHEVTALVRSAEKGDQIAGLGATPLVGDATDVELVRRAAAESDGVIHAASPGDGTSAAFDEAVVGAILAGLAGSGKPYVHTDGIWTFGAGEVSEDSEQHPAAISAWRPAVQERVRQADGVRTSVIVPGVVYGRGQGLPNLIAGAPRTDGSEPALHTIGDGSQHWPAVYVTDLAALYVLALEQADAGSLYIASNGENPLVHDLSAAASEAAGLGGRVAVETAEETRSRLGAALADALMLDQQATGSAAKIDFGWEPNGPSLADELTAGSYAPAQHTA